MLVAEAAIAAAGLIFPALFLGALAAGGFLLPAQAPPSLRRELAALALVSILGFLCAGFLFLWLQGVKLDGKTLPEWRTFARYIAATQSGSVWLAREAYAALLLLATLRVVRQGTGSGALTLVALFSLPLIAGRSLMSHAAAVKETTAVWIAVDALHLIATALWAGVLPFLWWIVLRGAKPSASPLAVPAHAARRFSALAIFSFLVLGATGILQSWIHVGETSALWGTAYGQVLLLKLMGVLAMAGVGCWNFFSTRPALAQATSVRPAQPAALRRIGAESALGVLVLCVTGFLTVLPPAAHRGHQSPGTAGSHGAHPPAQLAAAAGASVRILTPKPGQTFKGDQIPIRFVLVKGKRAEHVHAYVDGALMGMFKGETGTLTGVVPGAHTLELRAVTSDHQTELDAIARVDFFVR